MNSAPRLRKTGFTIIEMLIVVTILAMLAGILVPVLEEEMRSASDSRRASDLKTIQATLESYYRVNYLYPDTGGAWQGDAPNFGSFGYDAVGYIPGIVPDYIQALPKDPSGSFPNGADGGYMYRSNGLNFKFVINESPEFYIHGNPYFDPTRPLTAWQVSSPGGYNW